MRLTNYPIIAVYVSEIKLIDAIIEELIGKRVCVRLFENAIASFLLRKTRGFKIWTEIR